MKEYLYAPAFKNDARFFDELPLWSAPFGLRLLDYVEYKSGLCGLDIGFGTGFPLIELAMRLGDKSLIYGLDPWKEAVEIANDKIDAYGLKNIQIFEGEAEAMPFGDSTFDLITSNNGLNNTNDYEKAISECARVLKQGGQFVQTMNLNKTMFEFYDVFESVLRSKGMTAEIALTREHIRLKRRPIEEITTILRVNGFRIKDVEYDEFHYRFVDGSAFLNHRFIRMAFLGPWIELLPEDKVVPVFNSVELIINESSRKNGGFKLSVPFALINAYSTS